MIAILIAASVLDAGPSDRVALKPVADAVITGIGFASFVVPELLKEELAPASCHLCGAPPGIDGSIHDALTGSIFSRKTADTVSNLWAFAALPAASIAGAFVSTGPHASDGAGVRASIIVIESTAVSAAMVQSVKFFVARTRPFAAYDHGDANGTYSLADRDSHLGFPSGHTALATALGVSLATTATLEDSSAAPWLWGAAAVMSVTTGALRIIAEKHYFTDVSAGAAIGALSGVLVPLLHRRGGVLSEGQVSVGAQPPSFALRGSF